MVYFGDYARQNTIHSLLNSATVFRITVSIVARILIKSKPRISDSRLRLLPEKRCEGVIYSIINRHGKGRPDEAGRPFKERRALAESF